MRQPDPIALQIMDTTAGDRRQGSSTSALARGLDCGPRRPIRCLEQGDGANQGSGIEHGATDGEMTETQNS